VGLDILNGSGLRGGRDYNLAYSPERIDPGNTSFTFRNTPRLVGGLTTACRDRAAAFFALITEHVHPARGMREAEAAKILENTYRQVNVALVNEFMRACHLLGVDGWDAIEAAATKPFGFVSFRPGAGVGGSHVACPSRTRSRNAARSGRGCASQQREHAALDCHADLRPSRGSARGWTGAHVLLLGVTYTPNVTDGRNAPALPLAAELRRRRIRVDFHDPHVEVWDIGRERLLRVADVSLALEVAELTVVVQRHSQYSAALLARARRLMDVTSPPRRVARRSR
jgi:UDP-N-acetyl-D-glucosamine dehydrogenase